MMTRPDYIHLTSNYTDFEIQLVQITLGKSNRQFTKEANACGAAL